MTASSPDVSGYSTPTASPSSATAASLTSALSGLLPTTWVRALGGGGSGMSAETPGSRKPRLVPLKFQTKHVRKQYRLKRAAPSWAEWFSAHKSTLVVTGGVLLLALVLYLKWQDAQARRTATKKNRATSLQSLPPTTSTPHSPLPSLVPVVSSGPY